MARFASSRELVDDFKVACDGGALLGVLSIDHLIPQDVDLDLQVVLAVVVADGAGGAVQDREDAGGGDCGDCEQSLHFDAIHGTWIGCSCGHIEAR